MKLFRTIFFTLLTLLPAVAMAVPTHDSEGMPIFYIYGQSTGWQANDAYRFTRTGNTYSLHVAELDGDFKITIDKWAINYGSGTGEKQQITEPAYITGVNDGPNFVASHLSNVDITFDYTEDATAVSIAFAIGGVQPVAPDPVISHDYSGTLPVLFINVYDQAGQLNNEILSKDLAHKDYFSGEYWLELPEDEQYIVKGDKALGSKDEPLPLEIKARGNWTRIGFAKKPFKLKLGAKQKMLGMSKSKHYAILAHADDDCGYLKNFVGFNLGKRIGLPWTPTQRPIEVVINGDYRGLYFLTESIRVESDRINITELADNCEDKELVSGGYLVELDNYDEENQIRMEEQSCAGGYKDMLRITFDTPEVYSDLQKRFITDQFTAMNNYIGSNNDATWTYLDLDDAARYYLVEEIIGHCEAYHGSTYLFRDHGEGQKWHFSPIWDCGNAFRAPTDGFFYNNAFFGATWVGSMRSNDKFNDKVKETWKWFMSNCYDGIDADIDAWAAGVKAAAQTDRKRWKNAPTPAGGVGVVDNTDMDTKASFVKYYLRDRLAWLKSQFGDYSNALYAEPLRDTTPAASLPDYAVSGVIDAIDADAAPADAVFYNLQGMPVAAPGTGIYIMRRGTHTMKILVR